MKGTETTETPEYMAMWWPLLFETVLETPAKYHNNNLHS